MAGEAFAELQRRLRELWPAVTARSVGDIERTVVVVHSLSLDLPRALDPMLNAYEERFLCLVLSLLRSPRSRVVYVTSLPILRRVIDYWFELVPELDTPETRDRLTLVSVVDGRKAPLSRKLLDHPGVIERIRAAIPDPALAVILPFTVSPLEVELATRLGVPLYGADPSLAVWGTKSGGRRAFAEAGVGHPAGAEDLASFGDVVHAIELLREARPAAREAMVKLNNGVTGLGNGIVSLDGDGSTEARLRRIRLEDADIEPEAFFAALEREGGVVEERIAGEDFRSPSVQLRVGPNGEIDVLSTHDQVLGGTTGQVFVGARFPASPDYAPALAAAGRAIAECLVEKGVIGRFAVDFAAVRRPGGWELAALEVNLRCGGTTHPFMALQTLTDGNYDDRNGVFVVPGGHPKYYVTTDHLASPTYASLTPDDFFDLVPEYRLGWNMEQEVGLVFHLVSAIAVAGLVGVTAVGNTPGEASALFDRARSALDDASERLAGRPLALR